MGQSEPTHKRDVSTRVAAFSTAIALAEILIVCQWILALLGALGALLTGHLLLAAGTALGGGFGHVFLRACCAVFRIADRIAPDVIMVPAPAPPPAPPPPHRAPPRFDLRDDPAAAIVDPPSPLPPRPAPPVYSVAADAAAAARVEAEERAKLRGRHVD